MSHLSTYNSDVLINCKKSLLTKAAQDLGLGIDYDIKTIRNSWITDTVDAGFTKDGNAIAVGIKFSKEKAGTRLTVAGDFFGTGVRQDGFVDRLSQAYKKYDVIKQCQDQGWTITSKDVFVDKKTNEIVINASRMAV